MVHAKDDIGGFTLAEKEFRWQRVRRFLSKNGLDALLIIGSRFGEPLDQHLSNWIPGCTVIFPLEGEPTLLVPMIGPLLTLRPDTPAELRPWIDDYRLGARGAVIVSVLQEKGLQQGRIGVIGVGPLRTDWEGWAPYGTWDRVLRRLPSCTFEDVTNSYAEMLLPKTEQELKHVRRAAEVLEGAATAMVRTVRAGISELEVYNSFRSVINEAGLHYSFQMMCCGSESVGAWVPSWLYGVGSPRILKPGDMALAEIFASSAGLEAQVQVAVAIPPVAPEVERCAQLARQAYEAGLKELRPGNRFGDVAAAMHAAVGHPGVWSLTPLLHTMNPLYCQGATGVNIELMPGYENYREIGSGRMRGGDVVLQVGTVVELEPNACIGLHRVNIGGTAIVTEKGGMPLNEVPTRMRLAGEV